MYLANVVRLNPTSRLLKTPQAAQYCVKNRLTMLMYWRVHSACSPVLALSCTRLRGFQQPASRDVEIGGPVTD
jgi:hypothetical protein